MPVLAGHLCNAFFEQCLQAAGGQQLPAFFLPAKSINTAVVVIALDLSKPWAALDTCATWLHRTRAALAEQYKLLDKRGSQLPAQLKVCNQHCILGPVESRQRIICGQHDSLTCTGLVCSGVAKSC